MKKRITLLSILIWPILGIWLLQSNLSYEVGAAPLSFNGQTAASIWQTEMVDDAQGGIGYQTSLGIDANNNLHVSYDYWPDGSSQYLRYAHWDGSAWITETIERIGGTTQFNVTSLSVDKNNHPHISYDYDFGSDDLKYARWDGASWQLETVDSVGNTGRDNSLALDNADYPHISYINTTGDDKLKYAYWDGMNWQIQDVDSTTDVFESTSIALDRHGNPHIAYRQWIDNDHGLLKYAAHNGVTWTIQIVDNVGPTGFDPSLVLDSQDQPHISYGDLHYGTPDESDLKYAYWDGSQWQKETVDTEDQVGLNSSIAMDRHDNVYISYSEEITGALKFAFQDGVHWQIDVIDPDPAFGYWFTSLQLDRDERPIFSYSCVGCSIEHGVRVARWLGQTNQAVIDTNGGVFTATDTLTYTFPPGAFTEPVTVTFTTIPSVTSSLQDIGIHYELTAVYISNGQPASLEPGKMFTTTVGYDETNLPAGVNENNLKLYYQTDARPFRQQRTTTAIWELAQSTVVDTEKNEITAVDSRLGTWSVFSTTGYEIFLPTVIK